MRKDWQELENRLISICGKVKRDKKVLTQVRWGHTCEEEEEVDTSSCRSCSWAPAPLTREHLTVLTQPHSFLSQNSLTFPSLSAFPKEQRNSGRAERLSAVRLCVLPQTQLFLPGVKRTRSSLLPACLCVPLTPPLLSSPPSSSSSFSFFKS